MSAELARPQGAPAPGGALAAATATYDALASVLTEERTALLRGDAVTLRAVLGKLGELVAVARGQDEAVRAASAPGRHAAGDAPARLALRRKVESVRQLALANAQLLVRARDRTRRLLSQLEVAGPSLDRRA